MPPKHNITKDFMKLVLNNEKRMLHNKEVRIVKVPGYDELSLKNLYDKALEMPNMAYYFPSTYPKGRTIDRQYFWNVFNSLHGDTVEKLLNHSSS